MGRARAVAKRVLLKFPPAFEFARAVVYRIRWLAYALNRRRHRRVAIGAWEVRWSIEPANALDSDLMAKGGRYHWLIERILGSAASSGTVVDVGANAGYWALPLATRAGLVIAYEPEPTMLAKLDRNLRLNSRLATKLRVRPVALGSAKGTARLNVVHEIGLDFRSNTGMSTLMPEGAHGRSLLVEVVTLDDELANEVKDLTFIKVDVEGWESEVLRGGAQVIAHHRPSILWEALSQGPGDSARNVTACFELLSGMGYRHFAAGLTPPLVALPTPAAYFALGRNADILSVHPESFDTLP